MTAATTLCDWQLVVVGVVAYDGKNAKKKGETKFRLVFFKSLVITLEEDDNGPWTMTRKQVWLLS